jgi:hypothetical protein
MCYIITTDILGPLNTPLLGVPRTIYTPACLSRCQQVFMADRRYERYCCTLLHPADFWYQAMCFFVCLEIIAAGLYGNVGISCVIIYTIELILGWLYRGGVCQCCRGLVRWTSLVDSKRQIYGQVNWHVLSVRFFAINLMFTVLLFTFWVLGEHKL